MGNDTTDKTEGQTLTLRAEIAVLASERRWAKLETQIPNELPVEQFGSVETYLSELSGNQAVAVISTEFPDEKIKTVIRKTLRESEHARIALCATENQSLLQCEVPRDDAYLFPDETDEFAVAIKHLYIRAYYSVTADRYYKLSLGIKNHETRPSDNTDSGKLRQLKESCRRTESYLQQFRHFLDNEDFDAMMSRNHRYSDLIEARGTGNLPNLDLPDACPDCGLDWTSWHGPRLSVGYEKIGASTWRCTDCGHVITVSEPDTYRI